MNETNAQVSLRLVHHLPFVQHDGAYERLILAAEDGQGYEVVGAPHSAAGDSCWVREVAILCQRRPLLRAARGRWRPYRLGASWPDVVRQLRQTPEAFAFALRCG